MRVRREDGAVRSFEVREKASEPELVRCSSASMKYKEDIRESTIRKRGPLSNPLYHTSNGRSTLILDLRVGCGSSLEMFYTFFHIASSLIYTDTNTIVLCIYLLQFHFERD